MKQSVKIAILTGVILGAALSISRRAGCGSGRDYDPTPNEVLGRRLATETAKTLNGQGSIVVISENPRHTRDPGVKALWKGFKAGLKEHPQIEVAGIEGPESSSDGNVDPSAIPSLIRRAEKQFPNVDAVVSFVGLPDRAESSEGPLLMGYHAYADYDGANLLYSNRAAWVITPNWDHAWKSPPEEATDDALFKFLFRIYQPSP